MIERRRPLPAGRYWADIFRPNVYWDAWVQMYGQAGKIHGEVSEHFPGVEGSPDRDFVIFTTSEELPWPDADMKVTPSVAGPDVHSSSDTVQRPDPEKDPIGKITDIAEGVTGKLNTAFTAVLVVLVAGVAIAVLSRARKAPRTR